MPKPKAESRSLGGRWAFRLAAGAFGLWWAVLAWLAFFQS